MCNYLSKEENECLQAMEQVSKETEKGENHYKQKKSVAHT